MPTRQRNLLAVSATLMGLLAIAFAAWDPFVIDDRTYIKFITLQSAHSIRADVAADLRARILAQERVAVALDNGHNARQLWEREVAVLLRHYASFLAVAWLEPDYRVRWTVHRDPGARIALEGHEATERAFTAASLADGNAVLSETFVASNGRVAVAIVVPVTSPPPSGFVVGLVDAATLIAAVLIDHGNLGYAIAVFDEQREIYRTHATAAGENEWAQELPLPIAGRTWRIRVWPEDATVSATRSALKTIGFLVTLLLGLAAGLTIWVARLERGRAGKARSELERHVQERTADLQSANEELAREVSERRTVEESLRELSARLLQLQDEERRRIARELHDSTVQALTAGAMNIDKARKSVRSGEAGAIEKLLSDAFASIESASSELRTISYLLHPPLLDELGLESALPWYAEGFGARSGIAVSIDVCGQVGRLSHDAEITLFRIVQEALANIHRHSHSRSAHVSLRREGEWACLEIEDVGEGVSPDVLQPATGKAPRLGVGIAGMRERVRQLGGGIEIVRRESGTLVRARVPIQELPQPRVSAVGAE